VKFHFAVQPRICCFVARDRRI